jgi:hypothetical protein
MRDNKWLEEKLEYLWQTYFIDLKKLNKVHIHFGKKAKRRLASIRQTRLHDKLSDTQITVTGFYQDEKVPEYVLEATIAHELCHYAHGFASPHPQFSKYPHKGDIVDSELKKRGLGKTLKLQDTWLKQHWKEIIGEDIFRTKPRRKRTVRSFTLFDLIKKIALP